MLSFISIGVIVCNFAQVMLRKMDRTICQSLRAVLSSLTIFLESVAPIYKWYQNPSRYDERDSLECTANPPFPAAVEMGQPAHYLPTAFKDRKRSLFLGADDFHCN